MINKISPLHLLLLRIYVYLLLTKYLSGLIKSITTSPSFIDTGMVRGNQKIATFTITNTGEETLRNARIEGPSTSWMTLTNNRAIGDIKPGTSISIGIMFNPPATLAQGVYDDRVVIYSDNHIPYTYHIQVTVTSNAVGNVLFDVLNELMEDVPNASITFQHQTLTGRNKRCQALKIDITPFLLLSSPHGKTS